MHKTGTTPITAIAILIPTLGSVLTSMPELAVLELLMRNWIFVMMVFKIACMLNIFSSET